MKLLTILYFLFITTIGNSQSLYALERDLKKPAFSIVNHDQYKSSKYFVFDGNDKDSIIKGLEKYLLLITNIGRAPFPFDQTKAGNTTLKVLAKPMAYGDRYTISAETTIDSNVWRILFGNEKSRNNVTAGRIKKFLFLLKSI